VDIVFRTKQLRKCYESERTRVRKWGAKVARRYVDRINQLKAANSVGDLGRSPWLRYHSLKGPRKGQHAVWLTHRWRLIFTLHGDDLAIVWVEEVSRHYGD